MLMKSVVHLAVYAHRIVENKKTAAKHYLFFDEKIGCGAK